MKNAQKASAIIIAIITLCVGVSIQVSAITFTNDMKFDSRGADVVLLQQFLKEQGHFTFPRNTGYFGPYTFAAVKKFQKANNLPETGIVDAATRARIELLTKPTTSTTTQGNNTCHAPIGFVCDPTTNMPAFILTSPPGYGGGYVNIPS